MENTARFQYNPAMLSRRNFFKAAGVSAVAAATASFPSELLAWAEPLRESRPGGPVLLNANENAYGPFPGVLALPNPFQDANRYPDSSAEALVARLAKLHKVAPEQIVLGCGSTEILKIATSAFTGPGRKLIMASPTFEAVDYYAKATKAEVVKVPLASMSYAHNLPAMLAAAEKDTGLVYICNPNNPTGSITPRRTLENFLRELPKDVYVLMDEAYHDFVSVAADYISFVDHPVDPDRVIVARTFSKIYGMAGLRLGYAVTSAKTAKLIAAHRQEDSANIFALRCGLRSLEDADELEAAIRRNANDRDTFMREAAKRKVITIPSWTNFVMINTLRPVRTVIDHFAKNNIRIGRPFPPMDTFARISLGTPEQMKQFWAAWDKMPPA
ncbi:MAG TPA: histidinol-phosphate transaminase [Candidatus Angelobacter sp.]